MRTQISSSTSAGTPDFELQALKLQSMQNAHAGLFLRTWVRAQCLFDAEQDSLGAGDGECLERRLLKRGWLEMQIAGGYAR